MILARVSNPMTTVMAVTTLEVVAVADAGGAAGDGEALVTGDQADDEAEEEALDDARR